MPHLRSAKILSNTALSAHTYRMVLGEPEIAGLASPGQFLQVKTQEEGRVLLNKPLSISRVKEDEIHLVYQVVGAGTRALSGRRPGEDLVLMGPLGQGFPLTQSKSALLVGGGIGLAPLCFLLEALKKKDNAVDLVAGFNSEKDQMLTDFFAARADNLLVTSMDGSCGIEGHACTPLGREIDLSNYQTVYACGPRPMLKALKDICQPLDIDCYLSLESYMACGFGVCLGCVQAIRHADGSVHHDRVCMEGPVFSAEEVVFDD